MKLEGYRRLEAHIPTDLWDEVEKARGQMTRSEFTRQALRARLDYPSMVSGVTEKLAAPKETNGDNGSVATVKAAVPAVKTAREVLQERTRLMRGNNAGPNS